MPFPNLFLIGAPKAGTTFLFAQLSASPDIFAPRNKEPFYFAYRGHSRSIHKGKPVNLPAISYAEDAYLAAFDGWSKERYAIDGSTRYLSHPGAADAIKLASPDARILIVLREPVERAFSHYLMEVRDGYVDEDILAALDREQEESDAPDLPWAGHYHFVRASRYASGLGDYVQAFGSERLRVYRYEDICDRLSDILLDLSDFLGIDALVEVPADSERNAYAQARSPGLMRLFIAYRHSRLREVANAIFPRRWRDTLRHTFVRFSRKESAKPSLPNEARARIENALGDDYDRALFAARAAGVLFE